MDKSAPAQDDKDAEKRFNETLGRMLSTPPKPHKPKHTEPAKKG